MNVARVPSRRTPTGVAWTCVGWMGVGCASCIRQGGSQ
jgi:hypothetical protein